MVTAAIRWASIGALYDPQVEVHRTRAHEIGLDAPPDVFTQLFHEAHQDPVFALIVQWVDWAGQVVEGLRETNRRLEAAFDRAYKGRP